VSDTNTFDLIVIGSGSGLDVANAVYNNGLKIAVIEKDKRVELVLIEVACLLNYSYIVQIYLNLLKAHLFGIKIDGYSVDSESIVNRVNDITDHQSNEIENPFVSSQNLKTLFGELQIRRWKDN
jgi:mycothione reductase